MNQLLLKLTEGELNDVVTVLLDRHEMVLAELGVVPD